MERKRKKKRVVVSKSLVSVVSYAYAVAWLMTGLTDTISKSWLYQAQRDKLTHRLSPPDIIPCRPLIRFCSEIPHIRILILLQFSQCGHNPPVNQLLPFRCLTEDRSESLEALCDVETDVGNGIVGEVERSVENGVTNDGGVERRCHCLFLVSILPSYFTGRLTVMAKIVVILYK